MANLIIPNPNNHKYVVGIDFGHGETSAAICPIEWDVKSAESTMRVDDIRINPANTGNEKVLVSAISKVPGQLPQIGENAFGSDQLEDKASIKVCFKEPPSSIDGESEQLMISFMRAVYNQILDITPDLTEGNHIVYIARPSGWQNEDTKELYRLMAIDAGIPLGGLTSESRAAIFYAMNHPSIRFKKEIEQGAIVFDLGSSTLDFTYLSKGEKPIDYGYPHGASMIDKSIFAENMLTNDGVNLLLENHPQYEAALLFEARKIKEDAYKKSDKNASIDCSFMLRNVVSRDCSDFDRLKRDFVIVEYDNIDALTNILEQRVNYLSLLRRDLDDFKENHISGKTVKGVFLTGGASRMNFIAELIKEKYNLDDSAVRIDPDNPSLTISRGIAMLGRADAVSLELQKKLHEESKTLDLSKFYEKFKGEVVKEMTEGYWSVVLKSVENFKNTSHDVALNILSRDLKINLAAHNINSSVDKAFQMTMSRQLEDVRKKLNEIISIYAPGSEISPSTAKNIKIELSQIENNLNGLMDGVLRTVIDSVKNDLGRSIESIVYILVAWYVTWIALPIYIGKKIYEAFESEEKKRKRLNEEMSKPLSKSNREKICKELKSNSEKYKKEISSAVIQGITTQEFQLKKNLQPIVDAYVKDFINDNVNNVRIPIE